MHVPIYNGHITNHRIAEAQAMKRSTDARIQELERQVASEVSQSLVEVKTAEAKLKTVQRQVEQAEEALKLANAKYRAGTVRNLDLLDAETTLALTGLLQVQAEYAFSIASYSLAKAMGREYWK